MIPVLRFKAGVTLKGTPGGARIIAALDSATLMLGRDLTVTAGTNDHATGRHPDGEAYDLSVAGLTPAQIVNVVTYLRNELGGAFYVQYEDLEVPSDPRLAAITVVNQEATAPHIHAQVRKNTVYPPAEPVVNV